MKMSRLLSLSLCYLVMFVSGRDEKLLTVSEADSIELTVAIGRQLGFVDAIYRYDTRDNWGRDNLLRSIIDKPLYRSRVETLYSRIAIRAYYNIYLLNDVSADQKPIKRNINGGLLYSNDMKQELASEGANVIAVVRYGAYVHKNPFTRLATLTVGASVLDSVLLNADSFVSEKARHILRRMLQQHLPFANIVIDDYVSRQLIASRFDFYRFTIGGMTETLDELSHTVDDFAQRRPPFNTDGITFANWASRWRPTGTVRAAFGYTMDFLNVYLCIHFQLVPKETSKTVTTVNPRKRKRTNKP